MENTQQYAQEIREVPMSNAMPMPTGNNSRIPVPSRNARGNMSGIPRPIFSQNNPHIPEHTWNPTNSNKTTIHHVSYS